MSKQSVIIDEKKIDENGEEKLEVITEEDELAEQKEEKLNNTEEVTDTADNAAETAVTSEEIEETKPITDKTETNNEKGDEMLELDAVEIEVSTEVATEVPPEGPTEAQTVEGNLEQEEKQPLPTTTLTPTSRAFIEDDDEELMFHFSSPDISYEEYEEEETVEEEMEIPLEEKLNRNKLMDTYKKMILEKAQAGRFNELLNNQVFEYFNSKSIFRASLEDDPSHLFEIMQKYQSCLYELDRLIPKKNKITDECRNLINTLNNEELCARSEYEKNLNDLNSRLRETGVTFQSAKSGQFLSDKAVERLIRRMAVLRGTIQEERFNYIKTQAKMVEVEKKSKELEDLGNGLMMSEYEQLRTETQSLSEKIEECDNELSKLRTRCYSDTQILAHIREKEFMLSNTIQLQVEVNKELLNDLVNTRMNVNKKKLKLDDLRKKYKKMRENCGLLDKPLLLRDYDATVEKIDDLKLLIKELRENNDNIKSQQDNILMEMNAMALVPTESEMLDEVLKTEMSLLDKEIYPKVLQGVPKVRSFFKQEWDSKL